MNRGAGEAGSSRLGSVAALAVAGFVVAGIAVALVLDPAESALRVASPGALAPLSDGGFVYAERETGDVFRVDTDGAADSEPIAHVDVRADGQRGLVGLAARSDGELFAAWTAPDGRLLVGRILPEPTTLIWRGPETTDEATGGRIALTPDEEGLVVGIGNLLDPDAAADPDTPNGKLLGLDPDRRPDQSPEVLSLGWNNPFAFALGADGAIWVADNAPRSAAERFARGDTGGAPTAVTEIGPDVVAPAGLAVDSNGDLLVCGFVSGELRRHRVDASGRAAAAGELVASACAIDVAVLGDGRVVVADTNRIRVLDL